MKHLILLAYSLVLISLPIHQAPKDSSRLEATELVIERESLESCISERELAERVAALSSPLSKPELHREVLLTYARRSSTCRAQIVTALMRAMDKPVLDMGRDQRTFFLWHYSGEVLGELRATEALDLLLANLGVNDGESPSLTHFPAVATVIRIGSFSLPKLSAKLKHEESARMRNLIVFCIASIGGRAAKQTLVEALPNEKDKCVNNFIQLTLKSFSNRKRPNHVAPDDRVKWFSAFYCND